MNDGDARIFRSTGHHGDASLPLAFGRALVPPIALIMSTLMVFTLVGVLTGQRILAFVVVGYPAGLVAASLWAAFRIRSTVAEIRVFDGFVSVRTTWDSASGAPDVWQPVVDLRKSRRTLYLTAGLTSYELSDDEWPELQELLEALQRARQVAAGPDPA
jgi:hypothetical protein